MYQPLESVQDSGFAGNAGEVRTLIVTAVEAEREAVLAGLAGDSRFDVIAAGVGAAAAAAGTAARLARGGYGRVLSAGIAGGFAGEAEIGSLVVASRMVAADLGSDSPDGFISVDELGFGSSVVPAEDEVSARLAGALTSAGLDARLAPVLTVATTTGTLAGAQALAARVPGAAAEGMEGFGVAEAARQFGLPALELRGISNAVGPRDRGAWKIGEALGALRRASSILPEVFYA
ncbi:futalosine hydrolase [Saccharibacillus sp. CPCC 101409]|uniref:futalosine hydrolase n=1 Tax=Saccharibacillus sp. CPCC 101409 TaxID=3058041 RepID=UPI0026737CC3|nr:futalosine hydrolase [Saccharibacillus sp. CPCC 101409]MDO3408306.1 futalosine hydrolase [Saccharibacillus sp. CPCC 101409]